MTFYDIYYQLNFSISISKRYSGLRSCKGVGDRVAFDEFGFVTVSSLLTRLFFILAVVVDVFLVDDLFSGTTVVVGAVVIIKSSSFQCLKKFEILISHMLENEWMLFVVQHILSRVIALHREGRCFTWWKSCALLTSEISENTFEIFIMILEVW